MTPTRNWFEQNGAAYARYRPDYPPELAAFLAGLAPRRRLAVDVGCGNGQFTCQLAQHFEAVLGFDASADQLAHAAAHACVRYARAPAEALDVADGAADLITAAQAAHWFNLPRFYQEVERIATNGAILVSCPRNSYANFWDKQATKILIFLVSTLNLKSNGFQIQSGH